MRWFKTLTGPMFDQDGAAGGGASTGNDDPNASGKTFTQAEVDAMMASRWKEAEMTKAELKDFSDLIKQFGYEGATPAEIKAQIKAELDDRRKQTELANLQEEAKTAGASPELLADIKALKKEIAELKEEKQTQQQQAEANKAAEESWNQQVKDFSTKYPDIDMEKLGKDEKFVRFLKRSDKSVPFLEVYEDYVDLLGGAESAAVAKLKANLDRTTGGARNGGGSADGGTYGLNDHQQQLAKRNGMTNKEYAELLGHIKK